MQVHCFFEVLNVPLSLVIKVLFYLQGSIRLSMYGCNIVFLQDNGGVKPGWLRHHHRYHSACPRTRSKKLKTQKKLDIL